MSEEARHTIVAVEDPIARQMAETLALQMPALVSEAIKAPLEGIGHRIEEQSRRDEEWRVSVHKKIDGFNGRLDQITTLTPDQAHWVQMAIEREGKRAAFRNAVISKTLAGLLIAFVAAVGAGLSGVFSEYAANHGWKK